MYNHNMSKNEKIVRMMVGTALFVIGWLVLQGYGVFLWAVTAATVAGLVLGIIGVVLFLTGVFAWCPLNALLHHNTCEACKIGETHKHMPV